MAPRFITFEGLDGSGKSTHRQRAVAWMRERGLPVETTHEPGGTPLGEAIRGLFLDPCWGEVDARVEATLVFASRRQHLVERIEPALTAGRHVVCDRFTDSTVAYQGHGRGLSLSWIECLDRLATGGRKPDATLLFDLSATAAQARGQSATRQASGEVDRLDAENLAFYERVRSGYLAIAEAEPKRIHRIDSEGDKEATWRQVEQALQRILELDR